MKNLFDSANIAEIRSRIDALTPASRPLWGKMGPAQAMAHVAMSFELALGERRPPRMMVGRVIGALIKPKAFGNDDPMFKNSPTVPGLVVQDSRDFDVERARLRDLIDRFVEGGPAACTRHPHAFFGVLSPEEWAILMYKHTDHHLRQFGA